MADQHTGAMLAFLPSHTEALLVDGGEPADELHVTMLYLGDDHTQYTVQDRHEISRVLSELNHGPITATVTGVQTLGSSEPPATVLMLDSAELQVIRPRLKTELLGAGVPIPEDTYPEYLPHLTVGYGTDLAASEHLVGQHLTLDRIGAFYGPDRAEVPLQEETRMGDQFYAVIARMGVPTGDRRIIAPGAISHRDMPLALLWQEKSAPGHDGSVVIGRVDRIDTDAMGVVTAFGELLDPAIIPEVERARELIRNGVLGCSIDPGMVEFEDTMDGWTLFTRYEIGAFTALPIAAFANTPIMLIGDETVNQEQAGDVDHNDLEPLHDGDDYGWLYALTAAVTSEGLTDLPVAPVDHEWDGAAAANRVFDWATDGETTDWAKYGRAFLLRDDNANPESKGAHKLGVADILGGELTLIPRGVYAVASVLSGGRGGVDASSEEIDRLKGAVRSLYERIADQSGEDIEAPFSLTAAAPVALPPAELFTDPGFTQATPIMVSPHGEFLRITGHIGLHGQRHRGLPGNVTIPKSMSAYREFLLGGTLTAEGTIVPTGPVTMGGGHADSSLGMQAAAEHYDNVASKVAAVTAGDDRFGVWISGVIKPGVTEQQVADLLESPPSGDWRVDQLGNLEMITVHAVNVPGFAVYRVNADMQTGKVYALVASADFSQVAEPFSVDLDGDLEAQFADAGVDWPQLSMEIGGKQYGPVPVAAGCVRRMLGGEPAVDFAASGSERLRARARLALAIGGK
jgi:hypothetical protein